MGLNERLTRRRSGFTGRPQGTPFSGISWGRIAAQEYPVPKHQVPLRERASKGRFRQIRSPDRKQKPDLSCSTKERSGNLSENVQFRDPALKDGAVSASAGILTTSFFTLALDALRQGM